MPAADTVLLPLCVGLTLLGVVITLLTWRRGNKGRVMQGLALALAPVALYFSELLRLLWNGAVALGTWGSRLVFSPVVWTGLSLLGLCLVLWVVGGIAARRSPKKPRRRRGGQGAVSASERPAPPAVTQRSGRRQPAANHQAPARSGSTPAADDDMAEIEALLKSRGID